MKSDILERLYDMKEINQESIFERCGDTTPRDRRNQLRLLWAVGAWALSFSGVSQMIKRDLLPAGPVPWMLAVVPCILGVVVLIAYVRFLREADELQRIIQLQALAFGFGGTYFALTGYRVFERLGAPVAGLNDATLLMLVFYSIAVFAGWKRYR